MGFAVCFEDTPKEEACDVNSSGSVEYPGDVAVDPPDVAGIEVSTK